MNGGMDMASKEEMRKNVDSAIKVHELEGFKFTEEELAVFDRIANLEITTEEAREIFREKLAGKKEAKIVRAQVIHICNPTGS